MNITKSYKSIRTMIWCFACLLPLMVRAAAPDFPTAIGTNPVTVAEYRLVGVTTALTDGSAEAQSESGGSLRGFAAMDRICQLEYPDSRMATIREWQTSQQFAFPDSTTFVWLDPGPQSLVLNPTASDWFAYSTNGRLVQPANGSSPGDVYFSTNCVNYKSSFSAETAFVGLEDKTVLQTFCNDAAPVACSALVAVPVSH
jgi:hypothetical protein